VALGAAPTGSGYALAVRYRHDGPLVARLVQRLRDEVGDSEIDVRGIGAVRPQTGTAPPLTAERLRGRLRPLVPGCSLSHAADTAGTLGAVVRRGQERLLLTNAHVIAAPGSPRRGTRCCSRARRTAARRATAWALWTAGWPFDAHAANRVDAALARLDPGTEADPTGAPTTTAELDGDEEVEKLGRTTGFSRGRVTAIEVDDVVVDYGDGVGLLRFDGQVEVAGAGGPFSPAATAARWCGSPGAGPRSACCTPAASVADRGLRPHVLQRHLDGAGGPRGGARGQRLRSLPRSGLGVTMAVDASPRPPPRRTPVTDRDSARAAKDGLRTELAPLDGVGGIGIGRRDGSYVVTVNVVDGTEVERVPSTWDGVDVEVRVVGGVSPLTGPSTSPPQPVRTGRVPAAPFTTDRADGPGRRADGGRRDGRGTGR
jgi:hypothetical protein